uniref:Reverse transcriptase domain-containing protein n=1 Tax=Strongyloides venezuelensis TaxID=75913 RepID=A0A0K0FTC6_STRVS
MNFIKKNTCTEPVIIKEWGEHVMNKEIEEPKKCEFIENYFEETLKYTQNWKCPGENMRPVYLFKKLLMAKLFLKKWIVGVLEERIPITEYDVKGIAYAIYKSGEKTEGKNYRFINTLNSHYKIFMKYLNRCVRVWCKEVIPNNQFAGKSGVNGALDIAITNRVIQEMGNFAQGWYDMRKAYDSVDHTSLTIIIKSVKEIPLHIKKILCKIPNYYKFSVANRLPDKDENSKVMKVKKRKWTKLNRGIYQGCAMASWLFCLCLEPLQWKMKQVVDQIDLYGKKKVDILLFMDDIKGFGKSEKELQKITNLITNYGKEIGLELNIDKTEISLPEEDKIIQYKYMGIYESQKSTCDEVNAEKLLAKIDDKMNKIFNSRLNIKNIIKAINGCVIPTCTHTFFHEFSDEERINLEKSVDIRIRGYMNTKGMKLSTISNARCYLPPRKLGLGLRSAEVEMDKAIMKNLVHIILSPHLKDRAITVAKKDGINFQLDAENMKVKINNVEFNTLKIKEAKHKASELINEFAEKKWEDFYRGKKMFPQIVGEMSIECPWLNKGNVTPEVFKKALMYQDNSCNKLNSPGNTETKCILCNERDNSKHVMSDCGDKKMVKKRKNRHDRVLATIINSISYEKTNKLIYMNDLRKVHQLGNMKVAVDQPNYISGETIHHSRPDIIIEKEKEIIIAELSIVTPLHLLSTKKLKEQRYMVNGQEELITLQENFKEGPNFCNYLSKHTDKNVTFISLIMGPMGELDGLNNKCWIEFTKRIRLSNEMIWRASKEAAQQSLYIIDQYIKDKVDYTKNKDERNYQMNQEQMISRK